MALWTEQRIIISFKKVFLLFSDYGATFWTDEIFFSLSKRMKLFTLVMFYNKCMATRTLPANIT